MHCLFFIAFAGAAAALAQPQITATATTLIAMPRREVTAAPMLNEAALRNVKRQVPAPTLPYNPSASCENEIEPPFCTDIEGNSQLWCFYLNTYGHAGVGFSAMGMSCAPTSTTSDVPNSTTTTTTTITTKTTTKNTKTTNTKAAVTITTKKGY